LHWSKTSRAGINRPATIEQGGSDVFRTLSLAWIVAVATASLAAAQAQPPRFKFQKDQTLTYKVQQVTSATETLVDDKTKQPATTQTVNKLDLVKHWHVADVDAKGITTLELALVSMRMERKLPNQAEPDVFDSTQPDKLNQEEMARLIGKTLAVLRIDAQGRLVEVKESNVGPASRFVTDLPFKITLPDEAPKEGEAWERNYTIQLDPPHGTGEKYQATQKYQLKPAVKGFMVVGLTTAVKDPPTSGTEQVPLLPLIPQGDVYFHPETGLYYAARLKVQKELTNHQGEGSKYIFASTYAEDYVPPK
jgi:hypothetical protein